MRTLTTLFAVLALLMTASCPAFAADRHGKHSDDDRYEKRDDRYEDEERTYGKERRKKERRRGEGRDRGKRAGHVEACRELKGATKGLFGLCVAYCADAENPKQRLLDKYNARRTDSDPAMPCLADAGDVLVEEPPVEEPPVEATPVVSACSCWTTAELSQIDGALGNERGMVPGKQCQFGRTATETVEATIFEGYNLGTDNEVIVATANAYVGPNGDGGQGCSLVAPSGSNSLTLDDRAEGEFCIAQIEQACGG